MKEIATLTFKLFLISFIAALLLGVTYVITKEPIEQQEIQEATLARQNVLAAESFEPMDISQIVGNDEYASISEIYIGKDASGNEVGATIKMTAKGFNPGIVLTIGIDAQGVITGVNVGSNEETPGLGAKATEEAFYGQYSGLSADGSLTVVKNSPGENQILSIAGATKTSKGITDAVNLAAKCYNEYVKEGR